MNIDIISSTMGLRTYASRNKSNAPIDVKNRKNIESASVNISGTSDDAQKVKTAIDALPDVRLDMVEDIRSRIKRNDYPIENKIDDIIQSMLE